MHINLEKLRKNYTRIYYINKVSKVLVAHKLIVLELRILINRKCLLS